MVTNSQSPERDRLYSQIEHEYGSVVYSHATQEEQRGRLARSEQIIKIIQITLSAMSAAGLVGFFFTQQIWINAITAVSTFILLFVNSYSFRLEIGAKIARHRKAGDQLWLLVRKYQSLLVDFNDLDTSTIRERRNALIDETAEIYSSIDRTDNKSFKEAQKRLKEDGLKEFTRDELNKLLPEGLQK